MKLTLDREADLPLYRQVSDQIREYIRSGALSAGSQLPTVRHLASSLGLTRLTVQTAYGELQAQGLIESYVGRGTFVAERLPVPLTNRPTTPRNPTPPPPWYGQGLFADMMRMTEQPDLISFAQGIPEPQTFPMRELNQSMRRAMENPAYLNYGPAAGDPELREEVAHLLLDRGVITSPDNVLITSGTQQGIDLIMRSFTLPEDVLMVEEPTYPGVIELASLRRQRVIGVPVDGEGMIMEQLEQICQTYHPRLLYTVPTYHNPTGTSLSPARRERLLQLAQLYDFIIAEDDVYGFLAYDETAPATLKSLDKHRRVLYMTGFSKVLTPGLRLGALVADNAELSPLLEAKRAADLHSSPLLQLCLADYLRRRHFTNHLQHLHTLYKERRDIMVATMARYLPGCRWTYPAGGLCVWVTLPEGINERDFYLEAITRGVGITPGRAFFSQPQQQPYMRLCFGAQPPPRIEEGIAILGDLLSEHLNRRYAISARVARASVTLV